MCEISACERLSRSLWHVYLIVCIPKHNYVHTHVHKFMLNDRGMIIYTDFLPNSMHSWNIMKSLPPQKSVYIQWQSLDSNLLNMKVVSFPPNLLFPNKANPVKPHLLWDVYIVTDICTRSKYYKKHGRSGQNVCSLK